MNEEDGRSEDTITAQFARDAAAAATGRKYDTFRSIRKTMKAASGGAIRAATQKDK